jgi:hypothetical protein
MKNRCAVFGLMILVPIAAWSEDVCNVLYTGQVSALSADGPWLAAAGEGGRLFANTLPSSMLQRFGGGAAVSINGDLMAVGVPTEDGTGTVHLYDLTGNDWEPRQTLRVSGLRPGARFGASVALGATWLVVGAPEEGSAHEGVAYVFSRNGDLKRPIHPSDGRLNDRFGTSVAVDGNIIVVGAPYADDLKVFYNFGAAYVFDAETGDQKAKLQAADSFRSGDLQFGTSVAILGNRIVVGAPGDDPPDQEELKPQESAGSAHLFTQSERGWERANLLPRDSSPRPGRQLGISVTIDQNKIAVGAIGDGAAYLFKREDGTPDGKCGCGGHFGRSVALWKGIAFLSGPEGVKGCFEVKKPTLTCEFVDPPTSATAGGQVTYHLKIENSGKDAAKVVVTASQGSQGLPASKCSNTKPCTIKKDETQEIDVTFTVRPGCPGPDETITSTIKVNGQIIACTDQPTTRVDPPPMHLVCEKTGPAFVERGGRVVYQVAVTNEGCKPFRDVEVIDPAPPFLKPDCGGQACSSRIARIEPGDTRSVPFAFLVPSDYSGADIVNTARIVQAKPSANTSCEVKTPVRCPGLPPGIQGTIQADGNEFFPGDIIAYHLRLTNGGPSPQPDRSGAELSHTLPFALGFLKAEVVTGGGQLTLPKPSGDPTQSLAWNGKIPLCGKVDILVKADVIGNGDGQDEEVCLEAAFLDLDGRSRSAAPYCFRIVSGVSPSAGR